MKQAEQIGRAIMKMSRLYNATTDKFLLKEYKLTKPQIMVIGQIYMEPKTVGQITEAIQLSYSTVSGIIDRLERDGWIQRIRDQSDRRVIWIQRTEKMNEIGNTLLFYQEKFFQRLLKDLDTDELDDILRSLDTLIAQLEKRSAEKA